MKDRPQLRALEQALQNEDSATEEGLPFCVTFPRAGLPQGMVALTRVEEQPRSSVTWEQMARALLPWLDTRTRSVQTDLKAVVSAE